MDTEVHCTSPSRVRRTVPNNAEKVSKHHRNWSALAAIEHGTGVCRCVGLGRLRFTFELPRTCYFGVGVRVPVIVEGARDSLEVHNRQILAVLWTRRLYLGDVELHKDEARFLARV